MKYDASWQNCERPSTWQQRLLTAGITFDSIRVAKTRLLRTFQSAGDHKNGISLRYMLAGLPFLFSMTNNFKARRGRFYVKFVERYSFKLSKLAPFQAGSDNSCKRNMDCSPWFVRKALSIPFLVRVEQSTLVRLPAA